MAALHRPSPRLSSLLLLLLLFLSMVSILGFSFNPFPQFPTAAARRRLRAEPGSWPPACRFKCGRCVPCTAVHVPIQPGKSSPMEYYPEAWRCKCGNNLFLP
ncbi:EPIDERMAL PATTERNING FACTOR-like protein 5 [Andrographis paniculata]|uniref:EPIDERMAL PATTERNING FACTOR-like protein 5 n=1 Tax=Andrographis paniculata TaxID=175694 RepID=UPI0021E85923|nr:EPIDERMAL PATTERNING FACTOR-like protein 5 [Andrographis paniculata]